MFGAAAMSLSSFCVVTNALRLNLLRLHESKRDRRLRPVSMDAALSALKHRTRKQLRIEGMMCSHCEAAVKKALEALPQVESAVADSASGTATVTLCAPIEDTLLKSAVEAEDYAVLSIETLA